MMLDKWLNIGKRRQKLINKIIALDSSRSLEQLSKWSKHNLERELFFLENYPNRYVSRKTVSVSTVDDRIDDLIRKAKEEEIWVDNPVKGKWL